MALDMRSWGVACVVGAPISGSRVSGVPESKRRKKPSLYCKDLWRMQTVSFPLIYMMDLSILTSLSPRLGQQGLQVATPKST